MQSGGAPPDLLDCINPHRGENCHISGIMEDAFGERTAVSPGLWKRQSGRGLPYLRDYGRGNPGEGCRISLIMGNAIRERAAAHRRQAALLAVFSDPQSSRRGSRIPRGEMLHPFTGEHESGSREYMSESRRRCITEPGRVGLYYMMMKILPRNTRSCSPDGAFVW